MNKPVFAMKTMLYICLVAWLISQVSLYLMLIRVSSGAGERAYLQLNI